MRIFLAVAALAALPFAVPAAQAQDVGTTDTATATAPDGTRAFGIEPYVGILGGLERFDEQSNAGIPLRADGRGFEGGLVQGVAGVNLPLGPVFVGAEGNVAKGFQGDIDWEYGAAGRFGLRAGDSGLIYGKVGYQWVNFDALGNNSRDYHAITYGAGVEVGPKDIGLGGITGNAGVRLRLEVNTFNNAKSARPMAGVIAHF
jgi:outer membrane immunogenic protein